MDQQQAACSFRCGATSHPGRRRAVNEDAYHADRGVYFVADGMGGHDGGAQASQTAVDMLRTLEGRTDATVDDLLRVVGAAHRAVTQIVTRPAHNAGTTVSGAVVVRRNGLLTWLIANVGDSRTYRFMDGKLEQVTVDHSLVQELITAGEIPVEDARDYPRRHVITRALGGVAAPETDCWSLPIVPGERLVICSDGLTEEVSVGTIERVLREQPHPQLAADQLVNSALLAGGRDNVTVIVVDVVPGSTLPSALDGSLLSA